MKMTNEQKYILNLLKEFINQKGKGSCYAYKPVKPENILIMKNTNQIKNFLILIRQLHISLVVL